MTTMPPYLHSGRVAFHETDAAGIVHFSNYFRYAEEAETAALASLGIFSADSLRRYAFPRVQVSARYSHPLHFHEAYEVRAWLTGIGNSSLQWRFDIAGANTLCACVEVTTSRRHGADGSAAPYSPQEKAALQHLLLPPATAGSPTSGDEQK